MSEKKSTGNKPGHNASPKGFVETPKVIPVAPKASVLSLTKDSAMGLEEKYKSKEPDYQTLHQKVKSKLSFHESVNLFEVNREEIREAIEKIEEEKSRLENSEYQLWISLRDMGAEIMNTHRPIYDLEKLTLSNQEDWDNYRKCSLCPLAYPCEPYMSAKNALDKFSPYSEYDAHEGRQGEKVTLMLEKEAEKYAIENISQILSNGMARGTQVFLSERSTTDFPIGLIVRQGGNDLWIKTISLGWARLADNPGRHKLAAEYLKNQNYNISPHPFRSSDILIVEGFISKS